MSCTWDLSHDGIRDHADLFVGGSGCLLYGTATMLINKALQTQAA